MRIGVDCHVLSGMFQGSRTYMANLYRAILDLQPLHDFFFLGHWSNGKFFGENHAHIDYFSDSRWKRLTYQTSPLVRQYRLNALHCNYISPLVLPTKSILTVHDLLFETHPQFFNKSEVIRNRLLIQHSAKKAWQVHTVSEFSRQALIDIYGIPEERVFLVPDGVDIDRFSPQDDQAASDRIYEKYRIRDYILTVGRLEPRKNHVNLLKAYALLKAEKTEMGPLVMVGQKDFGFRGLFDTIDELGLNDDVRILESVGDDLLPDMYRGARMFVYPSFAEGFGIPPLEAMASGTPVVSSNTSAMPEVAGDASLLVDPGSVEDIARAMQEVLSDRCIAESLSASGRSRVERWTWRRSAEKYMDAIEAF